MLKICLRQILYNIVRSFHSDSKVAFKCNGKVFDLFMIKIKSKQDSMLSLFLFFGFILYAVKACLCSSTITVTIHTRFSDAYSILYVLKRSGALEKL